MDFFPSRAFQRQRFRLSWALISAPLLLCSLTLYCPPAANAQASPITASGLNTSVTKNGTVFDITGGTRPGSGANLFHSFGQFGVPSNNIANFLNETGLATTNILGRVTGGNPSNIFGTIQTTGFGNANLFLMNPAGIVFGPNASLNVGGSVSFTTADYLRLADGARFNAIAGPQDAAISSAPVAAFGFLGSNSGAITVQGSQLSVPEGQAISLVGGNIEVTRGTIGTATPKPAVISAPGGQINLASVASAGEILYSGLQFAPNSNAQSFTNMGTINLSGSSALNVSANDAGTIKIRAGQLVIADATLSADTVKGNGASPAIDINVTGRLSLSDSRGTPAITARTSGSGNAGEIRIVSDSFQAATTSPEPIFTLIDTHTSNVGRAGNVSITTGNLTVSGLDSNGFTFIDTGTASSGHGGDVALSANTIRLDTTSISTGDLVARNFALEPSGSAGNLTITADSLKLNKTILNTDAFAALTDSQLAGNITLNVRDINMTDTQISLIGVGRGGAVHIDGDSLVTDTTLIETDTVSGPGGSITVNARVVELTNSSSLISNTLGDGNAGDIRITSSDHVSLLGFSTQGIRPPSPSGLFSNSSGGFGDQGGNAGNITVTTPRLEMTVGRINTSTETSGRGGNVIVNANAVSISGEFPNTDFPEPIFTITDIHPSGIFTKTVGSDLCSGPCGQAGNISISTGSLIMGRGSQVDSGTSNTGGGGNITINATGPLSISGTLSNGTPVGIFSRAVGTAAEAGQGGNISLAAGQSISLSNGAAISASSSGPANAGNITINAGAQFLSQNASVTTQATQASGGNITVQATDSVRLVNSQINTSVQGGPNTSGGNITLDPAVVTLQNSQILAQAAQGAGGHISIVAGTFLADQTSLVSASSEFGLSGTVNIQSPVSNLSGTLATLAQRPLQTQPLLTQRCAAQLNGQLSSLVIAGRETLPTEPGGWLMSPLALMASDEPAPQAHVTTTLAFEGSESTERQLRQWSDHRSSQRGVTDRATGCGS